MTSSQPIQVYLALVAKDEVGNTAEISNAIFVRFGDPAPNAPTGLTAEAIDPSSIQLRWNYEGQEDYFELERRSETEANFRRIGIVDRNGAAGGTAEVSLPILGRGASSLRNEFSAREVEMPAVIQVGERTRSTSTTRSHSTTQSQSITRSPSASRPALGRSSRLGMPVLGGDSISALNVSLDERTAYTYRLRAFDSGGPSGYSNEFSARTFLAPPSNVTATQEGPFIAVRWSQSEDVDSYSIERAMEGGPFEDLAGIPGNQRIYPDKNVEPRRKYAYRISASENGELATAEAVSVVMDDESPVCGVSPVSVLFPETSVGAASTSSVQVTNTGGGTLQAFLAVECESFEVDSSVFILGPGETVERQLIFRPANSGSHSCFVAISSGCDGVTLSGNSLTPNICSIVAETNDFGEVELGGVSDRLFEIQNVGGGFLAGEATVESDSDGVFSVIQGAGPFELGPLQSREVVVRFSPRDPSDSNEALLQFGNLDCDPLPIVGEIASSGFCNWSISGIDFGSVQVGQSVIRDWEIVNSGTDRIEGVLSPIGCSAVFELFGLGAFSIPPQGRKNGKVTYSPTSAVDEYCQIRSENTIGPECRPLLITGEGRAEAECLLPQTQLDFGEVVVGESKVDSFPVANLGNGVLLFIPTVSEDCADGVFEMLESGVTPVLPGEEIQVHVRYTPRTEAQDSFCLAFFPGSECSPVELAGRAAPLECQFEPTTHDFGPVFVGQVYTKVFHLTNHTDEVISGSLLADHNSRIARIAEQDRAYNLAPGERHDFRFLLQRPQIGPAECKVQSSEGNCPEAIVVSWDGEFPSPQCNLSESELIAETNIGGLVKVSFDIHNSGNTPLQLEVRFRERDPLRCGPFSIYAGGGVTSVRPGGSYPVKVAFRPEDFGSTVCQIEVLVGGDPLCGSVSLVGIAGP